MLLYGICIDDIKNVKWDMVIQLLKDIDDERYEDYLSDMSSNAENDTEGWFDCYESDGMTGLGAFLHDVIKAKENIDLGMDNPNGYFFLGFFAAAPWDYDEILRNMNEEDFSELLRKYVNQITDDKLTIQWWKVDDDLDW